MAQLAGNNVQLEDSSDEGESITQNQPAQA